MGGTKWADGSLLLAGRGRGLGGALALLLLLLLVDGLLDLLDDTDGDRLAHVAHGEAAQGRVVRERLDAHGLHRDHLDDGGVARLDELGVLLKRLARAAVDLLLQLGELAGNVGRVAVEHWRVAGADLAGVVEDDDLGLERGRLLGGLVLRVRRDEAAAQLLDRHVLDVEADVVAGHGLLQLLVVHLDRLDLSREVGRGEGHDHVGLEHARLDTADGDGADAADLVHVLQRQAQGLLGRARGRLDRVEGLDQGDALDFRALLVELLPPLEPGHVGRRLEHVVAVPARDGDERHCVRVVADLLHVRADLLLDLLKALLRVLGRVHLVDGDDHLLHTEREGEQGVLARLAVLRDTGLELARAAGDDEDGAIGLRGARDHVLDEVAVAGGVDDRHVELLGLELPQGNVDGDATLALGLELVQHPGVLERALAHVGRILLELLDRALVDAAKLVDEVAGRGRLAAVDVADDDDVDVRLLLAHGWLLAATGCGGCCE
eukprot:Unigene667_Nuclearia_a/m.2098 Unigene667_Nuclearia_a/g.2098  ORF Unigene667_Nuclearia_a/g.2098 Unigene667_Nuclearia_a/m.2098 type:complete len:492 (-) Unigene667_Nuclearia_a:91-1566(-)